MSKFISPKYVYSTEHLLGILMELGDLKALPEWLVEHNDLMSLNSHSSLLLSLDDGNFQHTYYQNNKTATKSVNNKSISSNYSGSTTTNKLTNRKSDNIDSGPLNKSFHKQITPTDNEDDFVKYNDDTTTQNFKGRKKYHTENEMSIEHVLNDFVSITSGFDIESKKENTKIKSDDSNIDLHSDKTKYHGVGYMKVIPGKDSNKKNTNNRSVPCDSHSNIQATSHSIHNHENTLEVLNNNATNIIPPHSTLHKEKKYVDRNESVDFESSEHKKVSQKVASSQNNTKKSLPNIDQRTNLKDKKANHKNIRSKQHNEKKNKSVNYKNPKQVKKSIAYSDEIPTTGNSVESTDNNIRSHILKKTSNLNEPFFNKTKDSITHTYTSADFPTNAEGSILSIDDIMKEQMAEKLLHEKEQQAIYNQKIQSKVEKERLWNTLKAEPIPIEQLEMEEKAKALTFKEKNNQNSLKNASNQNKSKSFGNNFWDSAMKFY